MMSSRRGHSPSDYTLVTLKSCTVTVEVPTVATVHTVALAVLVSPSEERNLDFPYFMATDPITGHVYPNNCIFTESISSFHEFFCTNFNDF
jgi:hypothetical protein